MSDVSTTEPKLNSGEEILPEPDPDQKPQRAEIIRAPGEEPQVVPAKRKPGRPRGSGKAVKELPRCFNDHAMAEGMHFCPECGSRARIAGPQQCPNGHEAAESFKFCPECGSAMLAPELASAPPMTLAEQMSREQAHKQALEFGQKSPTMAYAPGQAPAGTQTTVIHFLVDGLTAFGNVWVRGQEIELWPGHPRWEEARDWICLSISEQYARYGRQVFGSGPWPGTRSYTAGIGHFQRLEPIGGGAVEPTEEELLAADAAEKRRGRRVPMPLG